MANKKKTNTKVNKKKNEDVSPIMMIALFIVFIIAMVFITYFGMNLTSPTNKYFSQYNTKYNDDLSKLLKDQKNMDQRIKEVSEDGGYTIDDPFIIKNPYGLNELTALIVFNTEKETYVKLKINDKDVTTVEKSTKHIVPIYYLYNDATNIVELTLDDGTSKQIEIKTSSYDYNIQDFDVSSQIGTADIYYIAGDLNSYESYFRGFNSSGNLISYIKFGYIGGYTLYKNKISLAYTQNKDVPNDLRIDIDYLGRINNITSNTNEINYESNISGDGIDYIGASYNIYSELIPNYTHNDVTDQDVCDEKTELSLTEYEDKLLDTSKYSGAFKLSYMDNFIAYEIEKEAKLLIVTSAGKLYQYNLQNKGIIKTDIEDNMALYIVVDGTLYSLAATLNA